MPDSNRPSATLFELITYKLGYQRAERVLPWSIHPLVLFGGVLFIVDIVVLQAYKELQGYTATFLLNPVWLFQPTFALFAALAVVYFDKRYRQTLDNIEASKRTENPETFYFLTPHRLTGILYLLVTTYRGWRVFIDVGPNTLIQIGGISELIGLAVISLGYNIIYAEFFTTYLTIMVLFPREIRRSDFKLDFLDPERLGGLRPVGELAKITYYFVVIGLVGYIILTYGPFLLGEHLQTDYPAPGPVTNIGFTAVWLLAVGTLGYNLSELHWFMKRKKREELQRLREQSHKFVQNRFNINCFEITDQEEFEELQRRIEYVNETHEYPTTFTMWSQILISVVLPKTVQLFLKAL